MNKKKFG